MFKSCVCFEENVFMRGFMWFGGKYKEYVLPKLKECFATCSFDLWMSKGAHNFFAFVIIFLGMD